MKIASATLAAIIALPILIGGIGQAIVKAIFGSGNTQPSQEALADIPGDYLALYQTAAPLCPGLDWSILAAIGKIESDHGRSPLPGVRSGHNGVHGPAEGAMGPMQFMPKTWRDVRAQHPEIGPNVYQPKNAIPGAAHYLCDSGAPKDIRKAIFTYNNADWYVNDVLAQAKKYGDAMVGTGTCTTIQAPNPAAAMAINYACGQLGLPYVWGGNGPDAGHAGFDCSGLTKAAYGAAGITLPRTAHTQYNAGPLIPAGEPLLPGDLLFYGTPNKVHHVGMYIGAGKMVHASTFGQPVKISPYRWSGDDYLAASRPANQLYFPREHEHFRV